MKNIEQLIVDTSARLETLKRVQALASDPEVMRILGELNGVKRQAAVSPAVGIPRTPPPPFAYPPTKTPTKMYKTRGIQAQCLRVLYTGAATTDGVAKFLAQPAPLIRRTLDAAWRGGFIEKAGDGWQLTPIGMEKAKFFLDNPRATYDYRWWAAKASLVN